MIPKFDTPLYKNYDLRKLKYPSEDILTTTPETGLFSNHDYWDERGWMWSGVRLAYHAEKELIERVDKEAPDFDTFDELMTNEIECPRSNIIPDLPVELGVSSVVMAVSAMNCAPVSSCRGHLSNGYEPFVSFWARRSDGSKLVNAIKHLPVGIEGSEMEGCYGLHVWARSCTDLLKVAEVLLKKYGGGL